MNSGKICYDQEQQQQQHDYDCVLALAPRRKARKEDAVNGQDWAFGRKLLADGAALGRGVRALGLRGTEDGKGVTGLNNRLSM